jgi:transposase
MEQIIRIGLDTSKNVFVVHGVDVQERPVLRRKLRRGEVLGFFAGMRPLLVGLEACGGSHHWARELGRLGHEVRLLPPQYVKAYVKRGKNDARDAEAICEAVGRPTMTVVPVKSAEQQAALMLHAARDLLLKQRTMLVNAIRGHAAEFGLCAPQGLGKVELLLKQVAEDEAIPVPARDVVALFGQQLDALQKRIEVLERRLLAWHRQCALSRRLATIPGIGPITATALAMKVPDPTVFRSGRHFAAWLGLTPKDHSTAGRQRLGGITLAGDEGLRRLLVVGATAVVQHTRPGRGSAWLLALIGRKPRKLAAVAWANKAARVAWALMISGGTYELRAATPA